MKLKPLIVAAVVAAVCLGTGLSYWGKPKGKPTITNLSYRVCVECERLNGISIQGPHDHGP